MQDKQFFIYILTNTLNTVLYIGVTNNLLKRVYEHKNDLVEGFTKKYKIHKLVYDELFSTADDAITREKQLKGCSRQKKINLIIASNPHWNDLYDELNM